MITDKVVNELIEKVKEVHKMENLVLVEKTVGSKIKLTFSSSIAKIIVELKTASVDNFIYENFLDEDIKKDITFIEFEAAYSETEITDEMSVQEICDEVINKIKESRLF